MEKIISAGLEELGLTGRVPEGAPAQLAQYGTQKGWPPSTCWTAPPS